nr:hypothetical protein [Tanacetum cinerariifolium]
MLNMVTTVHLRFRLSIRSQDRVLEIKDAFGSKQYKPKDMQELFRKPFNDVQNIHEELAEYINTLGWNRPALYDDDDDDMDYTTAITPVLSTKEPDNSLTHNSELVSLEVAEIVIPKDEEIEDDNLREKLLNVNLLIAKIEASLPPYLLNLSWRRLTPFII